MVKLFGIGENEEKVEVVDNILLKQEEKGEVWQVAVDILENSYEVIILAPIAWIALEDIDLSFNNSILIISWIRKKPEIFDEDIEVRNSECFWGKFVRNIILPENLDFDNIKATMENNLLVINIKKLYFESKEIKIDRLDS